MRLFLGWVLSELERNIQVCIEEKTPKVTPYLDRYDEWWLALVEYIGYGLSEFDQDRFAGQVQVPHPWSRIIIVNPVDPSKSFELI